MDLRKAIKSTLLAVAISACVPSFGQCPNIHVSETDSITSSAYAMQGWDTAITCNTSGGMTLHADAFYTTQNFNGTYLVEEIPFDPPEPFTWGTKMPISTDDDFGPAITINFPFAFFGQVKNRITLGANGLGSFVTTAGNASCPWSYSAPIPWGDSTSDAPSPITNMRDAIYGVYEDTYPYQLGNSARGIYYGVSPQSDFPCRHICLSWFRVPQYGRHSSADSATYNCTYQIVIYEGTNIIEVHVKKRKANPNWQSGVGIIGIQNATGTSAFYPAGFNTFSTDIEERAWRFTPQGTTNRRITWYRKDPTQNPANRVYLYDANENVNDSIYGIELPVNDYDQRDYVTSADYTTCLIQPTEASTYYCRLRYYGATGYFYDLLNTISVGCDTNAIIELSSNNQHVCQGTNQEVDLSFPTHQRLTNATWSAYKIRNGQDVPINSTGYYMGNNNTRLTVVGTTDNIPENYIDTTRIDVTANFANGCSNTTSYFVYAYPNYEFFHEMGICAGNSYTFCGHTYTQTGEYTANLRTVGTNCDSIEHLNLTVFETSYNIDHQQDCKPYTWPRNGATYYESNTATAQRDTVRMQNRYGCDSIVQLEFTLKPVHAEISADPTAVRLDNLNVNLIDISTGNNNRTWLFPDGSTSSSRSFSYAFPASEDSVTIGMIAHSPLGCHDTTSVDIRMMKETYWVPNVFTPGEHVNNLFKIYGVGFTEMELWIYNRWGEQVFYTNEIDKGWDGTHNGRPCEQGAYVYRARFTSVVHPTPQNVKGTITLLR